MHADASTLNEIGALLLLGWAVAMFLAVAVLRRGHGRGVYLGLAGVVGVGLAGQIAHMGEHVVQIGYWLQAPNAPTRMTPWGSGMGRGFGRIETGKPVLGMELLHLVGNLIFWAGLLGAVLLTRRHPVSGARRTARIGAWVQGAHCVEHLSLTASVWLGAHRPIGLSTWFGTLPPGPGLWTYRVWWHFWANAIPTAIFVTAAVQLWRDRRSIAAGFVITPAQSAPADPVSVPAPVAV
jgi:hypothetical protein